MWTTSNPFLNGPFEPIHTEYQVDNIEVHGKIPEELDGALYRTGGDQHFQPLNADKQHWFDGDGMVHAFFLRDGKAAYSNRWVRTEGFLVEQAAGRTLYNGTYGTSGVPQLPLPPNAPPIKFVAGINVVQLGGKVLTMHESAPYYWELDPATLDTIGTFAFDGRFEAMLTAHPHVDPETGEMLFYHQDGQNNWIECFSVNTAGIITSQHRTKMDAPSWIHDFIFSKDWYIFFLSPILNHVLEPGRIAKGLGAWTLNPEVGTRILLVNRHDGSSRWITEDASFQTTHFLNAYQDGDLLIVDACLSNIGEAEKNVVVSEFFPFPAHSGPSPFGPAELNRWTIDLAKGTSKHSRVGELLGEFLRGNPDVAGSKHRYGFMASMHDVPQGHNGFNCLVKQDFEENRTQYQYLAASRDMLPGEPIFVPRKGATAEDDGWVMAVWWDPRRNASEMVILDARDFDGEPVARIKLDHRVPSGFHGNWISRAEIEAGKQFAARA